MKPSPVVDFSECHLHSHPDVDLCWIPVGHNTVKSPTIIEIRYSPDTGQIDFYGSLIHAEGKDGGLLVG
jgi:hypothetical protein